jgi:hypothetical protein
MRNAHRHRRLSRAALAIAAGATTVLAGCGAQDEDYANEPRPPAPIVVSAAITSDGVAVSPRSFGAGPVTLIVSNQTGDEQRITLETDEFGGTEPGMEQRTGPITPGDTASLKADLRRGRYRVAVPGSGIDGTSLRVSDPRPSAQDQLLLP